MSSVGDGVARRSSGSWRAGSKVGRYKILKLLARGGMGEIYLAENPSGAEADRHLVLKRLIGETQGIPEQAQMFLDEARLAAALEHDNIVRVHEVGESAGTYFIAMEYLHGRDVRALLKELLLRGEKLPIEPALYLAIHACAAMHHAHELCGADGQALQIVHRDISPQNLMVTFEGRVKLLDFGIARSARKDRETTTRTMKGKVAYMSPEQCLSRPLDRRSDLFSLGVIVYELTVGTRLFRGNSDYELMQQIVQGTVVAPAALDPTYPAGLDRIVQKALQKPVNKRYQTARELGQELVALAHELRVDASPAALKRFMRDTFGEPPEAWKTEDDEGPSDRAARLSPPDLDGLPSRRTVEMPAFNPSRLTPGAARSNTGPMAQVREPTGPHPVIAAERSGPTAVPAETRGATRYPSIADERREPTEVVVPGRSRRSEEPPSEGARATASTQPTQPMVRAVAAPDSPRPSRAPRSARRLGAITFLVVLAGGAFGLVVRHRHRLLGGEPPIAAAIAPAPIAPALAPPALAVIAPAPAPTPPLAAPPAHPAPAGKKSGFGTVVVVATRHHALFTLDGKKAGTSSPLTLRQVDASRPHVLTASIGHKTVTRQFTVGPDEVVTLQVGFNDHGKSPAPRKR